MKYPASPPKSRFGKDEVHVKTREYNHINIPSNRIENYDVLGPYYLDMREAFFQYEGDIFGDFDEKGVPMVGWGKHAKYDAVNIAQYGFIMHSIWLENKSEEYFSVLEACVERLIEMELHEGDCIFWRIETPYPRYGLEENWASAMSQGECLSLYLRMYEITKDQLILDKCHKIYNAMQVDVKNGGVKTIDEDGNYWLEEYPSSPPSYVLNGFIYAIFGVMDYHRITKREDVKVELDRYIKTAKENVTKFDVGYWSIYDLRTKELVKFYYQKNVHVPQMEVLFEFTQFKTFDVLGRKWKKQSNKFYFFFIQIMYRVRPRIQKFKRLFK